ncbi:unnamed protein product [Mucor hiemalis]
MLTPVGVITTYSVLLILIPYMVSDAAEVRPHLLSLIVHYLNLDYSFNKIEPAVLNVGFVTLYVYVLLEVVADMVQAFGNGNRYTLNRTASHDQFTQARHQTREMFSPFAVSSFLIYANTAKFDVFRDRFITVEAAAIVAYPVVFTCLNRNTVNVFKCFYRSLLFWTILYALFPREASYTMQKIVAILYCDTSSNYNDRYGNIRQWFF